MDTNSNNIKGKYIPLDKLEIYQLSRELSSLGWKVYQVLGARERNIMGDQFIRSTDSVGANIAEGYSRFHYLDRIKFCYTSRASLMEASNHWLELLKERGLVLKADYDSYILNSRLLSIKLNNYISSLYKTRSKNSP